MVESSFKEQLILPSLKAYIVDISVHSIANYHLDKSYRLFPPIDPNW
jgi:hypothetical protein